MKTKELKELSIEEKIFIKGGAMSISIWQILADVINGVFTVYA
jgi:hypothetical protein